MSFANINLRHLRYFVAVAEHESISRAARLLHVSQPPLSRQMRDLEAELGVNLFRREAQRLILTGSGEIFLREARAVLQRFDDALALTREWAKRDGKRIRVGHSSASSLDALPRILRAFYLLHPDAIVDLRAMPPAQLTKSLRRGEVDACLLISGDRAELEEFTVEQIGAYRFLGAVPKEHPLAKMEKIPLREIARQPVISIRRAVFQWYNGYISELLRPFNPSFKAAEEHDRAESVMAAVEAGRGVALFYDVFAPVIGDRLALRDLTPAPPPVPLLLFHRRDRDASLVSSFVKAARAVKAS